MCYYNFYTSFSFHFFFLSSSSSYCIAAADDAADVVVMMWKYYWKKKEKSARDDFPLKIFTCFLRDLIFMWIREKVLEIERSLRWSAESFFCGARFKFRKKFITQFANERKEKRNKRKEVRTLHQPQRREQKKFFCGFFSFEEIKEWNSGEEKMLITHLHTLPLFSSKNSKLVINPSAQRI